MVSGLFVPILAILLPVPCHGAAATAAILVGGSVTAGLVTLGWPLPLGLDPNLFGIAASAITYTGVTAGARVAAGAAAPSREGGAG
jgi:SSS family solute:Na+ symporter